MWIDDEALAAGGLHRLAFPAPEVKPDGVIAAIYRTLVDALDPLYEVNAFDYDWRQPLAAVAAQVRAAVSDGLKDEGRRVHLVGHGWGGVVAVAAASHPRSPEDARCSGSAGSSLSARYSPAAGKCSGCWTARIRSRRCWPPSLTDRRRPTAWAPCSRDGRA